MLFTNEDKYNHEILRASQEEKVPFAVLKGIFALESAFNPKSYREEIYADPKKNDASYGLAQTLYRTAVGVGYTGAPEGLFDPYTSAKYGARFIANLHKQYNGLLDLIASYNMGYPRKAANTTSRIISIYGKPGPDWVYANQPYVDRVSAYIAYYQARERNDSATAQRIEDLIKKKAMPQLRDICRSLHGELDWSPRTSPPSQPEPLSSDSLPGVSLPAPEVVVAKANKSWWQCLLELLLRVFP